MTKLYTPDSPPEDLTELASQVKYLASFLNSNPQARHLLEEAKAGRISEQDCLSGLLRQEGAAVDTTTEKNH